MKHLFSALAIMVAATGSASAATIDLTDGVFVGDNASSQPGFSLVATESAAGVNFAIEALNNLVGYDRLYISANGITVGGGGGSNTQLGLTVDTDVELTGYGTNSNAFFLNPGTFDIVDGATTVSSGNSFAFSSTLNSFASGPLTLSAGTEYVLNFTTGAAVQGWLTSFEFNVIDPGPGNQAPAVPLPAGLPLLLAGLGAFAVVRRSS